MSADPRDPVEILAQDERWPTMAERRNVAAGRLKRLTKAGWRIVRTESVEASTDDGPDWFARIVDEWTPGEAGHA